MLSLNRCRLYLSVVKAESHEPDQAGGAKRDIIMVLLDSNALKQFRASSGWKAGVDGSVTLIDVGAGGSIDSATLNKPIVAFMVGQKGLMAGVSLDGSKISKLDR